MNNVYIEMVQSLIYSAYVKKVGVIAVVIPKSNFKQVEKILYPYCNAISYITPTSTLITIHNTVYHLMTKED